MDTIEDFVAVEVRIRESKDSLPKLVSAIMIHKDDVQKFVFEPDGLLFRMWEDRRFSGRFRSFPLLDQIARSKEWYPEIFKQP